MSDFYTHVYADRAGIYYRGYRDGKRVCEKIQDYQPSLFVPTDKPTPYVSVYGTPVQRIIFNSIKEAADFYDKNQQSNDAYVYGNSRWQYAYLSDKFENGVEFDPNLIRKATLDIETDTSKGFADPSNPFAPIVSITIKYRNTFHVFGLKDFTLRYSNINYRQFEDEKSMLSAFMQLWSDLDFDILFGWNTDQYDIPYIINRVNRIFKSDKAALCLSPYRKIRNTSANFRGRQIQTYDIVGIVSLDYIDLYRRYMPKAESDALKFVAELELGETKVEYDGTLLDLYTNDFNKFILYNCKDCALVEKLDAKLKLADVVMTTAYDSLCNLSDVQQQVRMWDVITFHHLKKKKIVVPPLVEHERQDFEGAYVLPAKIGKHKWVVSFDFASLYPSLIIEHNISPDTLRSHIEFFLQIDGDPYTREGTISPALDFTVLIENNLTCAGSGALFDKSKLGFLGDILIRLFEDRMAFKRKMKDAQKNALAAQTPEERLMYESEATKFNNFQSAKKVQLNSAYGALGTKYFRYFNPELARSVTLSGRAVLIEVRNQIMKMMKERYNTTTDPIIYGDTDSLYVSAMSYVKTLPTNLTPSEIVGKIDEVFCQEVYQAINDALKSYRDRFNTYKSQLEMVRDVIAEDTIFVSKKRYLMEIWDKEGTRYQQPQRKATGLEMIKSTTSKFCKEWLNTAADVILKGGNRELENLVDGYRKDFENFPLEMISYPVNVSGIEQYVAILESKAVITFDDVVEVEDKRGLKKGTPVQVAAAYTYNKFLEEKNLDKKYDKIKSGQRMRYFYLKEQNPFRSHVIGMFDVIPKEMNLKKWIDYEAQFNKIFLNPLNILLRAVKWHEIGGSLSIMGIFDN